jgi:hypothetical protein
MKSLNIALLRQHYTDFASAERFVVTRWKLLAKRGHNYIDHPPDEDCLA